jgi:hypothetical protein
MSDQQQELLRELTDRAASLSNGWSAYWHTYSDFGTWQYWVVFAIFAAPLVALVFWIDRKKAFRIGFYGLAVHVIAAYVDLYATSHRMWEYPFMIAPFSPVSFGLDASLIPVAYMFLYQWTMKRNKNYYVYITLMSAAFAFAFKPLLSWLGLFRFVEANYFQLFLLYVVGGFLAKWVANLFKLAEDRA